VGPPGGPQKVQHGLFLGAGWRRDVLVEEPSLRLRDVLLRDAADDDALSLAQGARDLDDVAFLDFAMRLCRVAVDVDLAALDGALGFGPRLEETRDVEPDIETEHRDQEYRNWFRGSEVPGFRGSDTLPAGGRKWCGVSSS